MTRRDQWPNERVVHHELKKMSISKRKELAKTLLEEAEIEERGEEAKHPFQDTDFENPFNTCPPAVNSKVNICLATLIGKRLLFHYGSKYLHP